MASKGLVNSVNQIRTMASAEYQNAVPKINEDSGIETLSAPLLHYPVLMNEFINVLVNKIAYTQLQIKMFNNPLKILEGDTIPLGSIGEEIYVNPAEGRDYDINDFSGLLKKYDADVKVQYNNINFDKQYVVTIIRQTLKKAFVSWNTLENFISDITTSLYNGYYIDEYNAIKGLVTNAYRSNAVQVKELPLPIDKDTAETFLTNARQLYLDFQTPLTEYNAWNKVGGYGREIISWTNPEDIVILLRNDVSANVSVKALAAAFNIDQANLIGRVIGVNNFNIYNSKKQVIFDGSKIWAMVADKNWFRIKEQDMFMEDFRNANNRSIQYYLNIIKMFKYSYFANAVVFATELPSGIAVTDVTADDLTLTAGENLKTIKITPANTTDTITVSVDETNSTNVRAELVNKNTLKVVCSNTPTNPVKITFKAGSFTKELQFTYAQK